MNFDACMIVDDSNRGEWLRRRRTSIGASEAAGVLGLSRYPNQSPLAIYHRKVGTPGAVSEPDSGSDAMILGILMEPVVERMWELRGGAPFVCRQAHAVDPARPFLSATIDGVTEDGNLVEIKTTGWRGGFDLGDENSDELPVEWITQAHVQMHIADVAGFGIDSGLVHFAVLVGGQDYRRYVVVRDDELIARMLPRLESFWIDHVVRRRPPPVTMAGDAAFLTEIYPDDDLAIDGDDFLLNLVEHFRLVSEEAKEAEETKGLLKAQIIEALGPATKAIFPDGSSVRRKVVNVAGGTYTRAASSYPSLYFQKPSQLKGRRR